MSDDPPGNRGSSIDLTLLDADPKRADLRYHELRRDLIRFLEWCGCGQPEDIADEAMFRGFKRIAEGVDTSKAGVRGFIFGVAKMVAKERAKLGHRERGHDTSFWSVLPAAAREQADVDARLTLDRALNQLSPRDRTILVRYYSGDDHDTLRSELGVSAGNLRLIVHRIRRSIRARTGR